MSTHSRRQVRAAAAIATATAVLATGTAAAGAPTATPQLTFVATVSSVTIDRYDGDPGVYLDLGTHLIAGKTPFEVRATRPAYNKPIVAHQIVRSGGKKKAVPLPKGTVTGWDGLTDFTRVTLKNAAGKTVADIQQDFCPNNYQSTRSRPDAPDTTPYPQGCGGNPFTLGAVWGIQAGWNAPTSSGYGAAQPIEVPDGTYTATVSVNKRYRDLFGIPANKSSATVKVTVRTHKSDGEEPAGRRTAGATVDEHAGHTAGDDSRQISTYLPEFRPAARRPAANSYPKKGPRPDLRSLPAWEIQMLEDEEGVEGDHLSFNATVWNAGPSPLVVDGFRRTGKELMDAYQYFYDAKGKQVGSVKAGTMEWDARDGHTHWHFTDFAQYRLLNASKKVAVRSGKEAFCLANTDAVDYTLPGAKWRPSNTDLSTSCGASTSVAVRQVLDVGSGDTYVQSLPGQSFDVTNLPNGTYYIEVLANPANRLKESTTANNASLRKVILGGTKGARTVTVPPHQGITG